MSFEVTVMKGNMLHGYTICKNGILQFEFFREENDKCWEALYDWHVNVDGSYEGDIQSFIEEAEARGFRCTAATLAEDAYP